MAAPKIETKAFAEPVASATSKAEEKRVEPTSSMGPGTVVESVAQYMDEFSAEEAVARMEAYVTMHAHILRGGVGEWFLPATHRHLNPKEFRFTRLGCFADLKQRDRILRQRFVLEEMGWKTCPPGTHNKLFQLDLDAGVYMMIPMPAWRIQEATEKKARMEVRKRRFSRAVDRLPEDMQGMRNMNVTKLDVQHGTMSLQDFRKLE